MSEQDIKKYKDMLQEVQDFLISITPEPSLDDTILRHIRSLGEIKAILDIMKI